MPFADLVKDALGFGRPARPKAEEPLSTAAFRREAQRKTVLALKNYTDPTKPKHIDWLKGRKQDLLDGSDTPSDPGDSPDLNELQPQFPGKMPIRATDEALGWIKSLKSDEGFDHIKFPPVFRDGAKIIAVNKGDPSADRLIGLVKTRYETDSNPASLDKIGVTLDLNKQTKMLSCVVLYPAIPTGLAVQSQPSSVNQ